MFYKIKLRDHVNLMPNHFGDDIKESIYDQLMDLYKEKTVEDIGFVITVVDVDKVDPGFKIPENAGRFYPVEFTVLTFKPELNDVIEGTVTSVTNFGAFVNIGIVEGLIHLSQTMPDQVSFAKSGVLQGRETQRTLKAGDEVRGKIIAASFANMSNIKIGVTMRQPGLGAFEWLKEDEKKKAN